MSIIDRIRAAQVNAGEMAVVRDLHERGLCDPNSCELCKAAFKDAITTKFATIKQSSVDPKDFSVEWPGSSVGMFGESEAKMWAAQMNEAYAAGAATKAMPPSLEEKFKTATLAPLDYWPWCPTCKQPFEFEPEEPFAYCGCGTTEWGDPRPAEYVRPPLAPSLEDKIAVMVWYLEEVRQRRRSADPRAFESYLDDSEVSAWLDKMNKAGRIRNTRFTDKRL